MKINKSALTKLANTMSTLPEGYEVKVLGFQKVALYLNGELLKIYASKVYASNGAVRHNRGQQA